MKCYALKLFLCHRNVIMYNSLVSYPLNSIRMISLLCAGLPLRSLIGIYSTFYGRFITQFFIRFLMGLISIKRALNVS